METAKALWAPFANKYSIHEETYQLQLKLMELGNRPYYMIGIDEAREQSNRTAEVIQGTVDFRGVETEMTVPSPHDPSGIPVTVYKPETCADSPTIFIFFHGGGLVVGCRQNVSNSMRVIARDSGSIVVNASYRLLPNAQAPCAPFEDGIAVTRWVMANKTAVGGTISSKVGVGGESSGGHITACVTNEVMGLDFQVLVYPVADMNLSQPSVVEFESVPILDRKTILWFSENSLAHIPGHETDPRYNPMARTNTELSPPALLVLAELDPLLSCGLDYAEKLRTAGVPVQCEIVRGVPHTVFISRDVTKTVSAQIYDYIVNFIKKFTSH
ncbi:hypothetical protein EGW08_002494 [Elysia chlorotica]|uniref:Alpha/beta hydrolase fold-3 domain-containing protein n=1 Tax=Elysia chlorotica TaxID=188477 RepID=A0A3S1I0G4_ELYCH|nr:hypothetical protein EGW08_002494 [Elysia chlorotica]